MSETPLCRMWREKMEHEEWVAAEKARITMVFYAAMFPDPPDLMAPFRRLWRWVRAPVRSGTPND